MYYLPAVFGLWHIGTYMVDPIANESRYTVFARLVLGLIRVRSALCVPSLVTRWLPCDYELPFGH